MKKASRSNARGKSRRKQQGGKTNKTRAKVVAKGSVATKALIPAKASKPPKAPKAPTARRAKVGTITVVAASLTLFVVQASPVEHVRAASFSPASYAALHVEEPASTNEIKGPRAGSGYATADHTATGQDNTREESPRSLVRDICVGVAGSAVFELVKYVTVKLFEWAMVFFPLL